MVQAPISSRKYPVPATGGVDAAAMPPKPTQCWQGPEMQKKIVMAKTEERWSVDDILKLRLGLEPK